jgi:hypothetical protein
LPSIVFPVRNTGPAAARPDPHYKTQRGRNADGDKGLVIANSAGAVGWALFYGLGAYYLGKGVEEFAPPFAMALAVVGAIVVVSIILYWRRKEQELAAAAERDIPGPLQAERSGEADR